MIDSLQSVLLALVATINSSQGTIRLETQSLSAQPVIMSLEGARKRGVPVSVVLGAKADYTLDATGQPTGGNRPYDSGPQGTEIRALDAMKASVFIPPKFSELDRPVFEPGVEMNANFALVDSRWATLCTAPFGAAMQGICWASSDQAYVNALSSLNMADQSDDLSPQIETEVAQKLATKDLILTPGNAADFYMLLRQSWRNVVLSTLNEGKALESLLSAGAPGTLWISPNGAYARTALEKMRRAGWTVSTLQKPFTGIALTGSKMAFIGSQKVDPAQIEKSRALGIVLPPKHATQIEQILQIR